PPSPSGSPPNATACGGAFADPTKMPDGNGRPAKVDWNTTWPAELSGLGRSWFMEALPNVAPVLGSTSPGATTFVTPDPPFHKNRPKPESTVPPEMRAMNAIVPVVLT